ncbi:Segregation and condensation protein A [Desulfotomaculum nigrificans CO-1-SRB]|uniref:Segregation and condensation protein A n=1 Tax=Desulfotomaculum nigrificans (strain DSM 14880 / VKM B-2319 / CO-1-SRB) TaxID=868595 RepID=F6B9A4_DESCC|nr:segregation/condensation protein A [Desulfotomaculum nigrificans]AEF94876.1 Segregation and condensation protein A [Desulfotomaculum nigrificans CO-1-SRB]
MYSVKLSSFEGPLDLLLHLIDKDQINIYDIPIAQITAQYLEYLEKMQQLDMDVASEFLVMAATLISIKARMLLPRAAKNNASGEEEGPDPREELVQRLLEYRKFKEAAFYLKSQERQVGKVYVRNNSVEMYQHLFKPRNPLVGLSLEKLLQALHQVLARAGADLSIPGEITREEIQTPDKMRQLMAMLVLYPQGLSFSQIFKQTSSRIEIIVTFLAVLELLKLGQINASQEEPFGEIIISRCLPARTEGVEDAGVV